MWNQIRAIGWAQFLTIRNHLPRSSFGSFLMAILAALWYLGFGALGVLAGLATSTLPPPLLRQGLALVLFFALLFWQWMPLLTLSGGWSLQLGKLQIYPISTNAFFAIETLLRLTTTPELVLVNVGAAIGLMCNPALPVVSGLILLLYVPFNLLLSLAIRETLLHSFERKRYRELFAVLLVAAGLIPQMFLRTDLGQRTKPFWTAVANGRGMPWREFALLASGRFSVSSTVCVAGWLIGVYFVASLQFAKALREEESPRVSTGESREVRGGRLTAAMLGFPGRIFRDPTAALVEKEIRTLVRMPRFRVVFGMACVFSLAVFFPLGFGHHAAGWIRNNFLQVVNLYGLLILGDSLLWNVFGFDRSAAQAYFVTAVELRAVMGAKNLTAALFIGVQSAVVFGLAIAFRFPVHLVDLVTAVLATAVVGLFFAAIGNLSSVTVPRAIDPSQTLRKQAGAQLQLWLLGSSVAMFALVGFAFLARWAIDSEWAPVAVFAVELVIGIIFYRISMDSAIERAMRDRERILGALSKSAAPVSV
ncbi:MAG: hypothetical protein JO061_03550 [Acidobacteriaceae bacterium]|nr:hypothetical protein [Acidobacteriaceae bacterium]